jgi:phage gp29-like protein
MAQPPTLVAADGVTPLARMLSSEIAAASMMSARSVATGRPADGLTPQRLAVILRGAEDGNFVDYLELAEAMEERYLHYLSVLGTRKRQVSQLPLTVEAASDAEIDQAKAQLVRNFLKRDTVEAELFDILDAVGKGPSFTEIVWNTKTSPWLPAALHWRDPRWFDFDRVDGKTPLLRGAGMPQPLPPSKFIFHVHSAKSGLPIRGGLARPVAWAYLFQTFALKDWVAFAEVYGFPIRVGKYDAGATEDQIRTLMRAVANVSQDAAAVFPSSMQMEFIASNSTGSADLYQKLCEYLDKQVSKAVLGQTATTDSEGGGLGGSGKEHNDVRGDIERADAKALAATLNRDLVKPIIDFNFGVPTDGGALYPQINIGREEAEDLKLYLDGVSTFVSMGGRVGATVVADKLGIPDPQPGEQLLVPAANGGAAGALATPGGPVMPGTGQKPFSALLSPSQRPAGVAAAATDPNAVHAHDDIDQLVQVLADEGWEQVLGPMVEPLRAAIAGAGTYKEALAALVPALASMDSAALAERLERAAFAVRAAGRTGADGQLSDG